MSYVCGLPTVLSQSHTCGFCAQLHSGKCIHVLPLYRGGVKGLFYLYTRVLLLGSSLGLGNIIYCYFAVRKFSVAQWSC